MSTAIETLTEKERATLRLIVRGHDAKSAARELDLSVHTINERLRNVRRKLNVTSSREAARLLLESESGPHENFAGKGFGEAADLDGLQNAKRMTGQQGNRVHDWRILVLAIGGLTMFSTLALALLASALGGAADPLTQPSADQTVPSPDEKADTASIIVESKKAALAWLELVDAKDWQASFDAAGKAFRAPNTVAAWRDASQQARIPLGDVNSRVMMQYEPINAPPNGFHIVRFRTDFASRKGAIETVTLEREESGLKVVGYFIG